MFRMLIFIIAQCFLAKYVVGITLGELMQPQPKYEEKFALKLFKMASAAYAISPDEIETYDFSATDLIGVEREKVAITPENCIKETFGEKSDWKMDEFYARRTIDSIKSSSFFFAVYSLKEKHMIISFRGTRYKRQLLYEVFTSMSKSEVVFDEKNDDEATEFLEEMIEDKTTDANFAGTVKKHELGKVNAYFLTALDTLWPDDPSKSSKLLEALKLAKEKDFDVTFTGHSLGGAIASLAAAKTVSLGLRGSDKVKLYTFGQPKVGSKEYAEKLNELVPHTFRVVNRNDIVPKLTFPPDNVHHGTKIWYYNGMDKQGVKYKIFDQSTKEVAKETIEVIKKSLKNYFGDHRHYFGHHLSTFGRLGCIPDHPLEKTLPKDRCLISLDKIKFENKKNAKYLVKELKLKETKKNMELIKTESKKLSLSHKDHGESAIPDQQKIIEIMKKIRIV